MIFKIKMVVALMHGPSYLFHNCRDNDDDCDDDDDEDNLLKAKGKWV